MDAAGCDWVGEAEAGVCWAAELAVGRRCDESWAVRLPPRANGLVLIKSCVRGCKARGRGESGGGLPKLG